MYYQVAERWEGVCINLAPFAALSKKEFPLTKRKNKQLDNKGGSDVGYVVLNSSQGTLHSKRLPVVVFIYKGTAYKLLA